MGESSGFQILGHGEADRQRHAADPVHLLQYSWPSSSFRSCAMCMEMPASDIFNSSAAACTEPNRTTAE